jgi:hypothetical protein
MFISVFTTKINILAYLRKEVISYNEDIKEMNCKEENNRGEIKAVHCG